MGAIERGAIISNDGVYRYCLTREWSKTGYVCWVMLNPSTADAEVDDMTITKCIQFCKNWGYGKMAVVNLFALRSTSPANLATHMDPYGPDNSRYLRSTIKHSSEVIVAWGGYFPSNKSPSTKDDIVTICKEFGKPISCLGRTGQGAPRHPSRLGYSAERIPWP